jgi:hypothetical protein
VFERPTEVCREGKSESTSGGPTIFYFEGEKMNFTPLANLLFLGNSAALLFPI